MKITPEDHMETLKKIKARVGEKTEIHWTEPSGAKSEETHTLVCADSPLPELYDAMQELRSFVLDLLRLPESWAMGLKVTGVTFTRDADGDAIVVTALKEIPGLNSPLVINTPLAPSDSAEIALRDIKFEAFRYVNGQRAQTELDLKVAQPAASAN